MPTSESTTPDGPVKPHQRRPIAESFGLDPARYDRSRPHYPEAFLRALLAEAPRSTAPSVLDVGCGTGIVARQLRTLGCQVLGVEPDPRMAAFAQATGVQVDIATLEAWDPAARRFDAVVAGQTWHWIDPVAGAARAAQALQPHGVFSAFWNVEQPPAELAATFAEVYRTTAPDSIQARHWSTRNPDPYAQLRQATITGLRRVGSYTEPREHHLTWQHTYTRQAWLDQLPTHGGHAQLSDQTMDALLAGIGAAIDSVGSAFTMNCTTTAVTAHRLPRGRHPQVQEGSSLEDR